MQNPYLLAPGQLALVLATPKDFVTSSFPADILQASWRCCRDKFQDSGNILTLALSHPYLFLPLIDLFTACLNEL